MLVFRVEIVNVFHAVYAEISPLSSYYASAEGLGCFRFFYLKSTKCVSLKQLKLHQLQEASESLDGWMTVLPAAMSSLTSDALTAGGWYIFICI